MIDVVLFATFVEVVGNMRDQQRRFFRAAPNTVARREALRASQAAERRVDELLVRLTREPELDLKR